MIHTGDCLEVMRTLPEASVDAVVTDPPYGLEFMGKGWDKFATTKRKDELTPRGEGHSTSAGPFLAHAVNQYVAGTPFQAWCEAWGREALRVTVPGGYLLAFGGTRTHHRLVCGLEDAGWIIRDELDWIYASGFPKGKANLKPAHEPIVLARKPGPLRMLNIDGCRIPSSENNGRTTGKGAFGLINDDGWEPSLDRTSGDPAGRWPANVILTDPMFDGGVDGVVGGGTVQGSQPIDRPDGFQRFDGTDYNGGEAYQTGPYTSPGYGDSGTYSRFFLIPKADRADREPLLRGQLAEREAAAYDHRPSGDINKRLNRVRQPVQRENGHPTVKPIELMRHLVRLVTPPGGTCLDPFLGSGTTAIAAEMEGFAWIGIEKEAEYVEIAQARLNGVQRGLGLDVPAPTKKRGPQDSLEKIRASGRQTHPANNPASASKSPTLYQFGFSDEEPA